MNMHSDGHSLLNGPWRLSGGTPCTDVINACLLNDEAATPDGGLADVRGGGGGIDEDWSMMTVLSS